MLDNIGDLSKPVTILVEKISNAVGVLYEPRRIVKKAQAEAQAEVEANRIKAIGRLDLLTELEQRGLKRLIHQEGRKQANIEQITAQAINLLPEDAQVERLNEDWIAYFFKHCDTVSDQEMQSLWAKLLSGEAARPGRFSKRTINAVSSINKMEAALFTALCQFNWAWGEPSDFGPLIYDFEDQIYAQQGINFLSLNELDSMGLITFGVTGFEQLKLSKQMEFSYFDHHAVINFPKNDDNRMNIGVVMLTLVGKELAPISGAAPNTEFFQHIIDHWKNQRLDVSLPTP